MVAKPLAWWVTLTIQCHVWFLQNHCQPHGSPPALSYMCMKVTPWVWFSESAIGTPWGLGWKTVLPWRALLNIHVLPIHFLLPWTEGLDLQSAEIRCKAGVPSKCSFVHDIGILSFHIQIDTPLAIIQQKTGIPWKPNKTSPNKQNEPAQKTSEPYFLWPGRSRKGERQEVPGHPAASGLGDL